MTAPLRSHGRTVESQVRQCLGKRRYPDEFVARAMGRSRCEQKPGLQLWLYHCKICQGWHLTSSAAQSKKEGWRDVNYDFERSTQ